MEVAVFGGSFNPPHVGHAMVAGWLGWTELVDEVWLLPSFAHPFAKDLAPFAARVALCEALAHAVGPWVRVEAIEAELPVPSFTFDVLGALAARHPDARLRLVVGADVLGQVDRWHRWADIVATYAPIVVGRVGYPEVPDAPEFPAVSSTEIRARLAAGEHVDALVPAGVRARLGNLYRAGGNAISP